MIDKVTRGTRTAGLIYYLFGPGRANEHTDPHVVAGFRHPSALEPGVKPNGRRDFRHLIAVLNHPLEALPGASFDEPVWHCSLRTAPTDRELSDEEWAEVSQEVMHRTGIAPRGDDDGCRWVAVRHADDHIHIVATLARQDGRRPRLWHDYLRVREACRMMEERYGLRATAPADRTAAARPKRAEVEQARRKGWSEPPRTTLRRQVANAAAAAGSLQEFFSLLEGQGVIVRRRFGRDPVEVTGYSVALPGHTNRAGEPVWFPGGKLAPDLSIPKLLHRWAGGPPRPSAASADHRIDRGRPGGGRGSPGSVGPSGSGLTVAERDTVYRQTATAVRRAAQQMRWISDPRGRADLAAATSDVLHVAAAVTGNRHLIGAADGYDRAAREPYGRTPPPTPYGNALRAVARALAITCLGRGRRGDPVTQIMLLIVNLALLVEAVAQLRDTQHRQAQAEAARTAARQLRSAAGETLPPAAPRAQQPTHQLSPTQLAAADFPAPLPTLLGKPAPVPAGPWTDRRPGATPSPPRGPRR